MRRRTSKNLLPEKMVGMTGFEPALLSEKAPKTFVYKPVSPHAHISKEQT